jgi:hypothetical protein
MDKSILERIEAHSAKLEKMEIEIPEWDLTFYISSITQRVAEKHFTAFAENPIGALPLFLVEQAKDKDGKRIFDVSALSTLKNADNRIFIRIASNVAKIMGASEDENPDCLGES